jgi:hypothetical protein
VSRRAACMSRSDVPSPCCDAQARGPFTPARPANTGQRENLHLFCLFYQDEIR